MAGGTGSPLLRRCERFKSAMAWRSWREMVVTAGYKIIPEMPFKLDIRVANCWGN